MSNKKQKNGKNSWVGFVFLMTFALSVIFSVISTGIIEATANAFVAGTVILVIIVLSIIFDMLGMAVAAASLPPLNSMAASKVRGARLAVSLVQNADKFSSIFNDVIGDICGIISGAATTYLVVEITALNHNFVSGIVSLLITGVVASLTVGGKALGKTIAIENSEKIIMMACKPISWLSFGKL